MRDQIVRRSNNTLPSVLTNTTVKQSNAFIEDVRSQSNFLQNSFLKLSSLDAFRLYQFNEWVFACINRIARDCVKVKPRIVPMNESDEIRPATQRRIDMIKEFFAHPNDNKETFRAMRLKFIKDLQIFGHGAFEKVNDPIQMNGNGMRQLLEIHNLQAANMEVNADQNGNLSEFNTYKLRIGNLLSSHKFDPIMFDKDEVIFQVLEPVVGSLYGLKPMDTLANSVASDILRAAYNGNFFVNGSEASGILSIEDGKRQDAKKVEEAWRHKFRGANNAHKMAVLNKKATWVRMALTNQDLQFAEYGIELRDKIFAVFNMQSSIFGLSSTSPGQIKNKQEAIDCYKEGAIKPILEMEANAYTREIIQDGFGFNDVRVSFDEIDKLDLEKQASIDKTDLDSAVITINEVRKKRGMPPVKWGDTPVIVVPGGGQIDPNSGKLIPPSAQPGASGGNKKTFDSTMYVGILGTYDINKFINMIKSYSEFLVTRRIQVDVNNVGKIFKTFEVYSDSTFKTLVEKSLCWKISESVQQLFLTKSLGNKKILKHYFDRIIRSVKDSQLYKDMEDYEAIYDKIN